MRQGSLAGLLKRLSHFCVTKGLILLACWQPGEWLWC